VVRGLGPARMNALSWAPLFTCSALARESALGMKVAVEEMRSRTAHCEGRRLDGAARPLQFYAPSGYDEKGFQASFLIFPTPGCWEGTARVGEREDSKITFVTKVMR
jgi:hypothetical protein